METVLANASGSVRKEVLHGRTFWVAPTILIKGDAVLNGSKGPLFYPSEEQAIDPGIWNGMPLVVDHPYDETGKRAISARNPATINERGIGWFFNATFNGDSVGESWFDEELTRKADRKLKPEHQMLPRLMRGEPIEQSTGVFTSDEVAANGAVCPKGTPYTHVARNYRADHIAVLPDKIGACSVKHGCGINPTPPSPIINDDVNKFEFCPYCGTRQEIDPTDHVCNHCGKKIKCGSSVATNNSGGKTVDKKALISWLTTNCECWKEKDDAKTLDTMSEDKLRKLKNDAVAAQVANAAKKGFNAGTIVANASKGDKEGEVGGVDIATLAEFLGVDIDPTKDPVGYVKEIKTRLESLTAKLSGDEPAKKSDSSDPSMETPTPPTGNAKKQTLEEWEKTMPPEARAVWNVSKTVEQRERQALTQRLQAIADATANERKKQLIVNKLKTNPPVSVLMEMLEMSHEAQPVNNTANGNSGDVQLDGPFNGYFQPSWGGSSIAHNVSGGKDYDEDDVLVPPTLNSVP